MVNYKLHLPKNTTWFNCIDKQNRLTWLDYWTTITASEDATNEELIELGRKNLRIQIAQSELFDVRLWQYVSFNGDEIEIVRA